jgi:hypothetical protein
MLPWSLQGINIHFYEYLYHFMYKAQQTPGQAYSMGKGRDCQDSGQHLPDTILFGSTGLYNKSSYCPACSASRGGSSEAEDTGSKDGLFGGGLYTSVINFRFYPPVRSCPDLFQGAMFINSFWIFSISDS